jgi:hypothetical protein
MDLIEIGELVLFAKEHYEPFMKMPDDIVSNYFTTYQDTIIVDRQGGEIRGFALYQIWPEFYNFIIVCYLDESAFEWLIKIVRNLAGKTAAWFDEKKMEPRFIKCHQ